MQRKFMFLLKTDLEYENIRSRSLTLSLSFRCFGQYLQNYRLYLYLIKADNNMEYKKECTKNELIKLHFGSFVDENNLEYYLQFDMHYISCVFLGTNSSLCLCLCNTCFVFIPIAWLIRIGPYAVCLSLSSHTLIL